MLKQIKGSLRKFGRRLLTDQTLAWKFTMINLIILGLLTILAKST